MQRKATLLVMLRWAMLLNKRRNASCLRRWYGALLSNQLELQGNKAPFRATPIGPRDSFSTNGTGAFVRLAGV